MNLIAYIHDQILFSTKAFGAGPRWRGISEHIKKELAEIAADPNDLEEWCDVVILGLDGAWRAGHTPEEIAAKLVEKLAKNKARSWPQNIPQDQAIEHIRDGEKT